MAKTRSNFLLIVLASMLISPVCVFLGCDSLLIDAPAHANASVNMGAVSNVQKPSTQETGTQKTSVQESTAKDSSTEEESVSPLITAEELKELIDSGDANLRILEPSANFQEFLKSRIPSARYLNWVDDMINPNDLERYSNLETDQFVKLVGLLGIENDSRIIIYDRLSSRLSTRLYWTFKSFGHDRVQILDGGFEAWHSQYKVSMEKPKAHEVSKTKFSVQQRTKLLAQFEFVRDHLDDSNVRFVDGRPADQYSGKSVGKVFHTGKAHLKKGHIPKAANVFWKDNFRSNGTFKPVDELRKLYENAGVNPDQCVVTYCNEGLHAAPPWFVLTQLLDYKDVRLYDNSMAEWANGDNPVEKD